MATRENARERAGRGRAWAALPAALAARVVDLVDHSMRAVC